MCASPSGAHHGADGTDGIRARKKRETHLALQAAARRLVAERGLDHVTVEEIAEAANVSKRTFFNYFDSKEAALVDAAPEMAAETAAFLAGRPQDEPPLESLRLMFLDVITQRGHEWGELTRLIQANPALAGRHAASYIEFDMVIRQWAADRSGTDPQLDLYPAVMSGVIATATQLTFRRWDPETSDAQLFALANEIFDLFAAGLRVPAPLASTH